MTADLFDALVAMTVAGSLAVVGVLAVRAALRRWFGAQVAYVAWAAVPLVALVMLLPAPLLPVATMLRIAPTVAVHSSVVAMPAVMDWRPALLALWLLGVGVSALAFTLQQRRYLRSLGQLRAFDAEGASRVLRAAACDGGPALIGAWRPRIVLPGDFEARYSPRERELILAHEQVHLARGDARINALVAALRCLNWFNPLIHLAATRFRIDQELACDAVVITRFPEARRPYADAMLKTQLAGQARQELRLPVGCRWSFHHPLKERIAMLKQPLPTPIRRAAGITLVALFGLSGAYVAWAAQAPQPVSDPDTAGSSVDSRLPNHDASEDVSYRIASPPTYPASAIKAHVSGEVLLRVQVSATGEPESATVIRVSPPEATALSDAAIAAVLKWHFKPKVRDGVAVAGEVEIPVKFELGKDSGTHAAIPEKTAQAFNSASYRTLSPLVYPASAIRNKIEGMVFVDATIDAEGRVTSATLDHAEPAIATVLGAAATSAVKTWRFNPAMRDGKPVAGLAVVPLRFALSDPKAIQPASLPPGALEIIDVVGVPVDP